MAVFGNHFYVKNFTSEFIDKRIEFCAFYVSFTFLFWIRRRKKKQRPNYVTDRKRVNEDKKDNFTKNTDEKNKKKIIAEVEIGVNWRIYNKE